MKCKKCNGKLKDRFFLFCDNCEEIHIQTSKKGGTKISWKIIGKPGEKICLITTEDEKNVLSQEGKIIICSYEKCEKILARINEDSSLIACATI